MSENMNMNENFGTAVSGVDIAPKKKGKKIALISGITVAVIAGGSAIAYNTSDFVKNQVNLRVMKPEKYYSWVIEENSKNLASSMREKYEEIYNNSKNGKSASLELKYKPSGTAKDMALEEILGYDDFRNEADDDEKILIDIVDNMSEISVGANGDFKDSMFSGNIFANLNGDNLINTDFAFDADNYDFFMRVPELAEQWLCVAVGDSLEDELDDFDVENVGNLFDYITPEELEDMIIRYTAVWNDTVKDIELEKKESIDICDISVNYTVVSAELHEKDLVELAINYLKEIRNDDVIKNILVNRLEVMTEDEYISDIDEAIKNLEEDDSFNNEDYLTIDTYIDPLGDIRGIKAYNNDDDELFCALGKDGDDIRGDFYFAEDNEKTCSIELYADIKNDKISGNIDATVYDDGDSEQVSVEFNNFEVVNDDKGYFNCGMTFIIPDIDPIHVDFNSDGKSQDISYNINIEGKDYGIITLSMSSEKSASPSVPGRDGAFIVDPDDDDITFADYIPEDKMKSYIYDLLIKIGFDDEIATDGAEDMVEEIYNDWEYDDDDYWDVRDDDDQDDDDWDFDWDDEDWDIEWDDDLDAGFTFDDDNEWNPYEEGLLQFGEMTTEEV